MEDDKKKYEDALERCKKEFNFSNLAYSHEEIKQRLEHVFPELKESEDEKARNEIMEFIYWAVDRSSITEKQREKSNLWIAWLEKQGERKQNITNLISDLENYFATTTKEQQKKDWDEIKKWEEKHFNHDRHIEQKPTDKIGPKFNVGDWIVNDYNTVAYIESITETNYILQCKDGYHERMSIGYIDKCWHLWTIQDAKDGDVLYHKSPLTGIEYIVMSKGINGYGNIDSYFRYNSEDGFGTYIPSVFKAKLDDITPATKEQRDFLFQEMKEAGYEWDVEKKELKKIEQKPSITAHKFRVGDTIKTANEEPLTITKIDDNGYWSGELFICDFYEEACWDLVKQKPVEWSEEDERLCQRLIEDQENTRSSEVISDLKEMYGKRISWLKSLKYRYTWKPSDEQMNLLEELVEDNNQRYFYTTLRSLYQDLKKIREK